VSLQKDKPFRSKKYLDWVKSLDCCLCGCPSDEAHHAIGVGESGMGTKACDSLTMPMCRGCHTRFHGSPEEWAGQWKLIAKTLQRAIKEGVLS